MAAPEFFTGIGDEEQDQRTFGTFWPLHQTQCGLSQGQRAAPETRSWSCDARIVARFGLRALPNALRIRECNSEYQSAAWSRSRQQERHRGIIGAQNHPRCRERRAIHTASTFNLYAAPLGPLSDARRAPAPFAIAQGLLSSPARRGRCLGSRRAPVAPIFAPAITTRHGHRVGNKCQNDGLERRLSAPRATLFKACKCPKGAVMRLGMTQLSRRMFSGTRQP
jgi:hypothetical protein